MLASRRQFLRSASASVSAMILGLPLLERAAQARNARQDIPVEGRSDKDFLELFQTKRAKEHKPGVIIVIPKDRGTAEQARNGLTSAFHASDLQLYSQAVLVCLPHDKARKVCEELSADVCLIPVDVHGKVGKPVTIEPAKFQAEFPKTCREMLLGKDDEKLEDIIKEQEKVLGKEKSADLHKAIADLDADDFERRDKAGTVIRNAMTVAPAILYKARLGAKTVEEKERLDDAIGILTKCPDDKKDDTLIPFGVAWVDVHVPCEKCSRSSAGPDVRRFLQFVIGK